MTKIDSQWYAVCDKVTGKPLSFCTADSQGFDLVKLQTAYAVNPVKNQPQNGENYDQNLKAVLKTVKA